MVGQCDKPVVARRMCEFARRLPLSIASLDQTGELCHTHTRSKQDAHPFR